MGRQRGQDCILEAIVTGVVTSASSGVEPVVSDIMIELVFWDIPTELVFRVIESQRIKLLNIIKLLFPNTSAYKSKDRINAHVASKSGIHCWVIVKKDK